MASLETAQRTEPVGKGNPVAVTLLRNFLKPSPVGCIVKVFKIDIAPAAFLWTSMDACDVFLTLPSQAGVSRKRILSPRSRDTRQLVPIRDIVVLEEMGMEFPKNARLG
jgi:hypothetical protein